MPPLLPVPAPHRAGIVIMGEVVAVLVAAGPVLVVLGWAAWLVDDRLGCVSGVVSGLRVGVVRQLGVSYQRSLRGRAC